VLWPCVAADIEALVLKMSTVSMGQSQTASYRNSTIFLIPVTGKRFSHLNFHLVGPSALVTGQFQVPANYGGQIIQVARDTPTEGHGDVIMHLGLAAAVALTFQHACR
jgi:hypothetical protein